MNEEPLAQQNENHETKHDRRTSQTPTHKTRISRKETIDALPRSLCAPCEMQPNLLLERNFLHMAPKRVDRQKLSAYHSKSDRSTETFHTPHLPRWIGRNVLPSPEVYGEFLSLSNHRVTGTRNRQRHSKIPRLEKLPSEIALKRMSSAEKTPFACTRIRTRSLTP